jgi:hypothetical protein
MNWKTYLIVIVVLIFASVYILHRCSTSRDVSEIKGEEAVIIQELEKADIEHVKNEEQLYKQLKEKEKQVSILDQRNCDLEAKLKSIVVPSTSSSLVDGFRKHGFKSAVIINGRICFDIK